MKVNRRIVTLAVWHLLFCLGIIFFFGNYCTLRVSTYHHPYKEYLSGLAVLFIVYINKLYLFPKYYEKGLYLHYTFWVGFSVFIAFSYEFILVSRDMLATLRTQSDIAPLTILFEEFMFVLLRDLSFAAMTFTVQAMMYYKRTSKEKDMVMLQEFNIIEALEFAKKSMPVRVNLNAVSYCQQDQNTTILYLVDGRKMMRNGTLQKTARLICDHYAVQISRSLLVIYKNIKSYNHSGVIVKSFPQDVLLSFSDSYQQNAFSLILQHTGKAESEDISKMLLPKPKKRHDGITILKKRQQQQQENIIDYIIQNPGCSATDIKKNRSVSQSTINRILAQLKKDGLIEYTGSRRNGGYIIKEENKNT